jgi:hypothetical protein
MANNNTLDSEVVVVVAERVSENRREYVSKVWRIVAIPLGSESWWWLDVDVVMGI